MKPTEHFKNKILDFNTLISSTCRSKAGILGQNSFLRGLVPLKKKSFCYMQTREVSHFAAVADRKLCSPLVANFKRRSNYADSIPLGLF